MVEESSQMRVSLIREAATSTLDTDAKDDISLNKSVRSPIKKDEPEDVQEELPSPPLIAEATIAATTGDAHHAISAAVDVQTNQRGFSGRHQTWG